MTITGGLKTTYTTPAHGTAYDIVGQGKANVGAMAKAFELCVKISNQKKQTAAA